MIDASSPLRPALLEGLDHLQKTLSKLPRPVAKNLQANLDELRLLLLEQRPARVMLVGRRGSGKSSLVNAILGEQVAEVGHEKAQTGRGRWWPYSSELGTLEILDTRGLQEGSKPTEDDDATSPLSSLLHEVTRTPPDLILFTVKSHDVDSGIHTDINQLAAVVEHIYERTHDRPPIIGVVTHCDSVEPKHALLHAPRPEDIDDALDYDEKLQRTQRLEQLLSSHLHNHSTLHLNTVASKGVCTYQSFRRNGALRADERWNIEELLQLIIQELPHEARVEFARLSQIQSLQRAIADQLTTLVAAVCAGIATVPIPVADLIPITSLQTSLISGIAYLAGRQSDVQTAREFLAAVGVTVGAGVVLREVARALSKTFSPGTGTLLSAALAYAGTVGIGRAASAYFLDEEPREHLRNIYTNAKKHAEIAFRANPALLEQE